MIKRVHIVVSGRVQGVCFRMYAEEQAARLDLTGWIRNLSSGDVETVAEGEEEALGKFADWCRSGPPSARVTGVKTDYSRATGEFDSFTVEAGG